MIWTTHSQTWVSLERMRRFTKEKCFPWLCPLGFFESISLNKLLNHDNPAVSVSQTVCATMFGLKNCCLSILSTEYRASCSILSKRSTTELNSQRWEGCNPKGQDSSPNTDFNNTTSPGRSYSEVWHRSIPSSRPTCALDIFNASLGNAERPSLKINSQRERGRS